MDGTDVSGGWLARILHILQKSREYSRARVKIVKEVNHFGDSFILGAGKFSCSLHVK